MKRPRSKRNKAERRAVRAFITGISGFVGAHLARVLSSLGDVVTGANREGRWPVDLVETMRAARIDAPRAWDIADEPTAELRRFLAEFRPDVVYHLAALSIPEDCGAAGPPTPRALAINVDGTMRVAELATAISCAAPGQTPKRPRLIFASSSHVYGAVEPSRSMVAEDAPLNGTSAYAVTKRMAEERLLALAATGQLEVVIARAFKHVGARQDSRLMLAEWAAQFAAGVEPVRIRSCDSVVDMTDVRDVCLAYRLLAERGVSGRIYNVGSGVPRRTGDIFLRFRALARPGCPFVETHPGFRQEPIADIRRIKADTGWSPTLSLDDSLRGIWQAYIAQIDDNAKA